YLCTSTEIFIMQKRQKTTIFLVAFFIILSAVFMGYYYKLSKETPKTLPQIGEGDHKVRSFSFVNQEGATITDQDVKDKIRVVEYFFTTCKGICPKMNENMTKVYEAFRGNEKVLILSHTVDPLKDTVAAMKEYSKQFNADADQWLFLTGDKKELYDMVRYSYLVTAADDTAIVDIQSDFIHTEKFVLVDATGHIRGQYDGTNEGAVQQLIGDIKILLEEEKS